MPEDRAWANRPAGMCFLGDQTGAVVADFVVLTAALAMGAGVTITTLGSSLGVSAQMLSSDIPFTACENTRDVAYSDRLSRTAC